MPTEPTPPSVADVVRRAVEICDPDGSDPALADLAARFEDRDEPVTALDDPESRLAEGAALDEDLAGPAELMAVAVSTYLAHRRDEFDDDPQDVLRLTARAEFGGEPPEPVREWLAERGIEA